VYALQDEVHEAQAREQVARGEFSDLCQDPSALQHRLVLLNEKLAKRLTGISNGTIKTVKEYLSTPGSRDVYGVQEAEGMRRFSQLQLQDDTLLLHALQFHDPPATATILPLCPLQLLILSPEPKVFFRLAYKGHSLGTVTIALTGAPCRMQQMLELCSASISHSWKGATFDRVRDKGRPGERIACAEYIMQDGGRSRNAVLTGLEPSTECGPMRTGRVYGWWGDEAGFIICTRESIASYSCPLLGYVVQGLPVLHMAIENYDISQIAIAEVGLVVEIE
ncbi:unnamed protein product, partial [Meganyctiphanes norvegica]